ncbi:MAG TPA: DUF475 domain-containing protein [Methanocorpusculum sp.]|nr:DUF475 domain-containing protein [Candidatus Methanocorpusculum equi]MCQ2357508.1 DUF475 domain-containing protein [Methanocorpusculum sp.]HJJ44185.1 DUF475 domain-containing protein [Methanocorpusculum sp.]HJJ58380.1 DUF475 domain-containing protein [Methanocorpusculum sp.]HJJ59929.1 DUF475 domain-containing protein [Methanocorpusculum sp.]
MDILYAVLIVIGLCVFETIASIDNAIINADILSTMKEWARKWFLVWGLLIAVFVVRGLLPWIIIWVSAPSLGPIGALTATFSGDGAAAAAIEASAPYLLLGGGVFLALLFLHWLMAEEKNCIVPGERIIQNAEPWFTAAAAVFLLALILISLPYNPALAAAAAVGFAVFFIMMGIRHFADKKSLELEKAGNNQDEKLAKHSDVSKLVLLEVIDASFSVDGVVGAFAFTMSVPLILIGNGLGALVVRQLTIKNIDNIKKFAYLKNGAMYSILCLAVLMCAEAFGLELPVWVAPAATILIVGIFLLLSIIRIKKGKFGVCKI